MPAVKEDNVVLTEDADRFTPEERAMAFFMDRKAESQARIDRRLAMITEAKRHDVKDPNIPFDLDWIENEKAILRGHEDAIAGATRRAKVQTELVAGRKPEVLSKSGG